NHSQLFFLVFSGTYDGGRRSPDEGITQGGFRNLSQGQSSSHVRHVNKRYCRTTLVSSQPKCSHDLRRSPGVDAEVPRDMMHPDVQETGVLGRAFDDGSLEERVERFASGIADPMVVTA